MTNELQDQVAIVTGSSSGNGRAIAITLAVAGATVVCADQQKNARPEGYENDLQIDTDEVIRQRGGTARYIQTNFGKAIEVENLVARTVLEFGHLDILVNNAGVTSGLHTIVDETEEAYDLTMAVNAKGVWLGCKYAIIQMLTQRPNATGSRGKIVNVSSIGGLVGIQAAPAYCSSKGAVVSLTRQLALDFAPKRINVNAVCPGYIATAMTRAGLDNEDFRRLLQQQTPWPRLGTALDVANSVLFFCSPASEWISGSVLAVDGAFTAR
jgi:NAD(P)-dependent dehydrogenase (short-subunit alcohol dehydrogenase family)